MRPISVWIKYVWSPYPISVDSLIIILSNQRLDSLIIILSNQRLDSLIIILPNQRLDSMTIILPMQSALRFYDYHTAPSAFRFIWIQYYLNQRGSQLSISRWSFLCDLAYLWFINVSLDSLINAKLTPKKINQKTVGCDYISLSQYFYPQDQHKVNTTLQIHVLFAGSFLMSKPDWLTASTRQLISIKTF
jgi:hypothetical protein